LPHAFASIAAAVIERDIHQVSSDEILRAAKLERAKPMH